MTDSALARLRALIAKGRWPAGAPGSKGGQFAPANEGGGGGGWGGKKPSLFDHLPSFSKPPALGAAKVGAWSSTPPHSGSKKPHTASDSPNHSSGTSWKPDTAPPPPPKGAKPHGKLDDKGQPVLVHYPTKPSEPDTWDKPDAVATFTPGSQAPATLNGVPMTPWTGAPTTIEGWAKVPGQKPHLDADMPITPEPGKSIGSGVIVQEPDGRIWLTRPTNSFGGYQHTFPKGTIETGLSLQAGAIKEAYEETGLKVEITGVLGDFERTTSKARFYVARRVGGTPSDMGWESQAIKLAPVGALGKLLNMPVDKSILEEFKGVAALGLLRKAISKARPRSLYVRRNVVNADELVAWAKGQGFATTLPPEDMHVTIAFSRAPVDWMKAGEGFGSIGDGGELRINPGGPRMMDALGPTGAAKVLLITSWMLQSRHRELREIGASWDFPEYQPHITISYDPDAPALETVEPYQGAIVLGPEVFEEVDEGWRDRLVEKAKAAAKPTGKVGEQARWPAGSPLGGQWKAVGADGLALPPKIATASNPSYGKQAAAIHAMAQANDTDGVAKAVAALTAKVAGQKAAGQVSSHVKWTAQTLQYATDVLATKLKGPTIDAAAHRITGPVKISEWTKIGGKPGGSNPGALFKDTKGEIWLVKGNAKYTSGAVTKEESDARAHNEIVAAKLIEAAGGGAPKMRLVDMGGQFGGGLGVASKMIPGVSKVQQSNLSHLAAVREDFAIHAWLGNYDVLGLGLDNTVLDLNGTAVNIDPGGAMLFRAQGLPKDSFAADAPEWETMRTKSDEQKSVYGTMSKSQLQASAQKLALVSDDTVKQIVAAYGADLKTPDGAALADRLIERKAAILKKAGLQVVQPPVMASPKVETLKPVPPPEPPKVAEAVKPAPAPHAAPEVPVLDNSLGGKKMTMHMAAGTKAFVDGDLKGLTAALAEASLGKSDNAKKAQAYLQSLKTSLEASQADAVKAVADGKATVAGKDGSSWTGKDGVLNPAAAVQVAPASFKALNAAQIKVAWVATGGPGNVPVGADAAAIKAAAMAGDVMGVQAVALTGGKQGMTAKVAWKKNVLNQMGAQIGDESGFKMSVDQVKEAASEAFVSMTDISLLPPDESKTVTVYIYNSALTGDLGAVKAAVVNDPQATAFKAKIVAAMTPPAQQAREVKPKLAGPDFAKKLLPETNSNAPSHNKKVAAIEAAFQAGDQAAILGMAFGTNTYNKQQVVLANDALAALGSAHVVSSGQKAGAHPALLGGTAQPGTAPFKAEPNAPKPTPTSADGKPLPKKRTIADLTAKDLPAAPDVYNFKGPGNAYSSKQWKNDANHAILQQMQTAALAGGMTAVDAITFPELNPETGAPTGNMLPITKHPAQSLIKAHYESLSLSIDEFLNPPEALRQFTVSQAATIDAVSAKFKAAPILTPVSKQPANQQIGFWIALGQVANPEVFAVPVAKPMTGDQVKAGAAAYQKYSSMTKQMISFIQGSGSANDAFREGKATYQGVSTKAMAKAAYEDATALPNNTTITRWQNMPKAMLDQMVKSSPGLVFDALGSMCTSYSPTATSGFGTHTLSIRSGTHGQARVLHSHGSGAFTGEKEVTTLPNQRFMLLGKKPNNKGGWEFDILMLPTEKPPGL